MRRIVVIGTSGSGKTTLARELARRLNAPTLELDAIHWQANWTPTPPRLMAPILERHVAQPAWTTDGNYTSLRELTFSRADTIIWLDYSLGVVLSRVLRRTVRRLWTNQVLWNGNRESLWTQIATRESIFLWVLETWRTRRRDYPKVLAEQRRLGKRTLRFRTPAQAERWLSQACGSATQSTQAGSSHRPC